MSAETTLIDEIKYAKLDDSEMESIKVNITKGKALGFYEDEQGVVRLQGQICVLQKSGPSAKILLEAHITLYSIHRGGTKMYKDL